MRATIGRIDAGAGALTPLMSTDTRSASLAGPAHPLAAAGRRDSWAGVASLGLGVFALVMAEFLPASLLTTMAADLGVSEGVAGQSVTVTALVAAVAGLALPVVLPRIDRRLVMLGLTTLAIASSVLVAVAPNYPVLLAARILIGIAIGGFWALAIAMTAQLVAPARLGRAMTVVNTGVSLATVAAIPLGAWLSELWGWRAVFLLAAGVGLAALAVQLTVLPSLAPAGAPGLRQLGGALRSRLVVLGLVATAFVAAGHFTGFTYINPAAQTIAGFDTSGLATLLLVYGVAAFAGNLVAGPLVDRRMRTAILVFPTLLGAAMAVFALSGGAPVSVVAAVALWGFAFGAVPTTLQTWLARSAPDRLESVGGLQVAAFQLAIAAGAVVGGVLVDSVGVQLALIAGGASAVVGGVLLSSLRSR